MENIKQNILVGVIIVVLAAAGILFYFQQKAINQLRQATITSQSALQKQTAGKAGLEDNIAQTPNAEDVKSAIDKQKNGANFIIGKVLQMSENSLKVEADIPDWKKKEEIASSPELSMEYENKMAPTVKKTYNVSIAGDTQFFGNQLSGIKAGDTVMVSAKELVYQTDNLTATEIASPFDNAPPAGIQP